MLPIPALGLGHLVQPQAQYHDPGASGQFHSPVHPFRRRSSKTVKPLFIALQLDSGVGEGSLQILQHGNVYRAGARPLIAGDLREIADKRHAASSSQRQKSILVFQQYYTLPCRAPGKGVVGVLVKLRGGVVGNCGIKKHPQILIQPLIQKLLRKLLRPDGLGQ